MKAIFWDFDATLAYNDGKWTGTATDLVNERYPELPVRRDDIRPSMSDGGFPWHNPDLAHPGQSPDEWWESLQPLLIRAYRNASVPEDIAIELAGLFRAAYLDISKWHLFDDTITGLAALRDLGWKHYILSNHVPELPSIVEQLELMPYLEEVSTSAETGYEKPNPEAFRQMIRKLPKDSTIWMIGDNIEADVIGAEAVGLPAILVRSEHPDAQYSCNSLVDIPKLLTD